MYLHLDANTVIRTREIVAILDIENSSVSRITREFFAAARRSPTSTAPSCPSPSCFARAAEWGGCMSPIWRPPPCGAGWNTLRPACADPAEPPVLFPLLLPTGAGGGCFVYHLQPGRRAG